MQMGFGLVGRDQQREQQIDGLIVDSIEGDGVSSCTKTPTARSVSSSSLPCGIAIPLPIPVLPIFSRVRIASNTTCGGKPNCFAASSLMISSARFCSGSEPGYGYIPG
jgi:hypothetical protein